MKPTMAMLAYALIASFEGERLTSYQDSGGVWTNGIGNTHGVKPGETITHEQAIADFERNCSNLLHIIEDAKLPIIKGAALVSFGFNCGTIAMVRAIANVAEISRPVHTTDRRGVVLPGLVTRRNLEAVLCEVGS